MTDCRVPCQFADNPKMWGAGIWQKTELEFHRIPTNCQCPDKDRIQFNRGKWKVLQPGRKNPALDKYSRGTVGWRLILLKRIWGVKWITSWSQQCYPINEEKCIPKCMKQSSFQGVKVPCLIFYTNLERTCGWIPQEYPDNNRLSTEDTI